MELFGTHPPSLGSYGATRELRGKIGRFWARPFLIILLAHTVFSIGIWNARAFNYPQIAGTSAKDFLILVCTK
jgi:hypothetical protein